MTHFGRPTVRLTHPHFTIEALAEGGPRIVRLVPNGTDLNLLAEVLDAVTVTAWGPYHFLGGHRLWHAPEAAPRSYEPDDSGVTVTVTDVDMNLVGPVEAHNKIRKSIRLLVNPQRPLVHVEHRMENHNVWPVEMAAWAITQMRLGGTGILPVRKGDVREGLLPDRQMVFWPYADLNDDRFKMDNDWLLVEGIGKPGAFKVGAFNPCGWIAYLYEHYLFVKRFDVVQGKFSDYGCNAEIYVMDQFLEIETQGSMTVVNPGEALIHVEEWSLTRIRGNTLQSALEEAGLT